MYKKNVSIREEARFEQTFKLFKTSPTVSTFVSSMYFHSGCFSLSAFLFEFVGFWVFENDFGTCIIW